MLARKIAILCRHQFHAEVGTGPESWSPRIAAPTAAPNSGQLALRGGLGLDVASIAITERLPVDVRKERARIAKDRPASLFSSPSKDPLPCFRYRLLLESARRRSSDHQMRRNERSGVDVFRCSPFASSWTQFGAPCPPVVRAFNRMGHTQRYTRKPRRRELEAPGALVVSWRADKANVVFPPFDLFPISGQQ